jgi:hypothetical protein
MKRLPNLYLKASGPGELAIPGGLLNHFPASLPKPATMVADLRNISHAEKIVKPRQKVLTGTPKFAL